MVFNMVEHFSNNVKDAIVAAAIRGKSGKLYIGARHNHCFLALEAHRQETGISDSPESPHEQGFVTADGRFLTREDAAQLALKRGQVKESRRELVSSPDIPYLFSEDLR